MRLIAQAKPVKIRIKSGGMEHSTLDSLKHHFVLTDIIPLLDGRLERWLRQQGESVLAIQLEKFCMAVPKSEQEILVFIKLFFQDEFKGTNILSLKDLAKFWLDKKEYTDNLASVYQYLLTDIDGAKLLYRMKDSMDSLSSLDWKRVFTGFAHLKDAESLYILGNLWLEHNGNKGLMYLEMSAEAGWLPAIEFLKSEQAQHLRNRFWGIDRRKMKRWYNCKWDRNFIRRSLTVEETDYANNKELQLLQFISDCYLFLSSLHFGRSLDYIKDFYAIREKEAEGKFLHIERTLVLGLLLKKQGNTNESTRLFESIKDQSEFARIILKKESHYLTQAGYLFRVMYIIESMFKEDYE